MKRICQILIRVSSIVVLGSVSSTADLFVRGTVTPGVGQFHYQFEVENTGPEDYILVTILDGPIGDALIDPSLTAPADFLASYDSGLGFVDFLEFTGLFAAGTTVSGFSFDSLTGPTDGFTQFEAVSTDLEFLSPSPVDLTVLGGGGTPTPDHLGWALPVVTICGVLGYSRGRGRDARVSSTA